MPSLAVKGFDEFNRGDYFQQHETLEGIWFAEKRPVREMYQGILQLGLVCYHIQGGRYRSALKMWKRSSRHLKRLPKVCQGVQVWKLREVGVRLYETLLTLGPDRVAEFDPSLFPQVEWLQRPETPML